MKMPNLASVNQAGVGLLSMESQLGWYCALAAIEAAMNNRPNGFIDEAVPLPIQFRIYGPDGPRAPAMLRSNCKAHRQCGLFGMQAEVTFVGVHKTSGRTGDRWERASQCSLVPRTPAVPGWSATRTNETVRGR